MRVASGIVVFLTSGELSWVIFDFVANGHPPNIISSNDRRLPQGVCVHQHNRRCLVVQRKMSVAATFNNHKKSKRLTIDSMHGYLRLDGLFAGVGQTLLPQQSKRFIVEHYGMRPFALGLSC